MSQIYFFSSTHCSTGMLAFWGQYVSIILSMTSVLIVGLLALTGFIFINCPGVCPAGRWWGVKQARRNDLLGSRWLCLKYKCSNDRARWVDPLKQNTTALTLQSFVVPSNQCCVTDLTQLQSSAPHYCSITQDQLPDHPVVSESRL